MNLICSVNIIYKVIIYINKFGDIKRFKYLIFKFYFDLFIFFIFSLLNLGNGYMSINNCYYK